MVNFTIKDSRRTEFILHPSTQSVAKLLEGLQKRSLQPSKMLDLGCGSGLLALYMVELWPECKVIASDISALAVSEAKENMVENGAAKQVECVQADGMDHRIIRNSAPYDIIAANLVAELQTRYIADIKESLAADGFAILSGILEWRMQEMEAAISHAGLCLEQQIRSDKWMTLLLTHAK